MRRWIATGYCLLLFALVAGCGKPVPPSANPNEELSEEDMAKAKPEGEPVFKDPSALIERFHDVLKAGMSYRAVVVLAKGGEFEIGFFPNIAPNHVANFVSLARKGFYDGVTFHRVIEGFMAQGGDPTGTGSGGPGYTIPAEFSEVAHKRGIVSMARTSNPNSAGSQFFICFGRAASLDGQYTVFGKVTRGMKVVDGLRRRDPESDRSPGDAIKTVTIIEAP